MVPDRRAAFLFSLLAFTSTTAVASIPKQARLAPHDSRALLTIEKLPDAAKNAFAYDSTGARHQYQDPTAQKTIDVNDQLGRPLTRTYQDGTVETHVWEGSRLASFTDRQSRKQQYIYDAVTARLIEIRDGSGTKLDQLEYDAAGRLKLHLTKDALVESLTFDNDGHPLTTSQTRYKNSSGFGFPQMILDRFGETHTWNAFGERTSWTMPRPTSLAAPGWTDTVTLGYDGAGNLTQISRTQIGGGVTATPLMNATFRNAGRPTSRSVTTSCTGLAQPCTPAAIVRNYGYDATSGQRNEMQVVANGTTVAGTHVNFQNARQQNTLQAHDLQLLGISSGGRTTHFEYDERGRLTLSLFGASDPKSQANATKLGLTPADFLTAEGRTPHFDPAARAAMTTRGVSATTLDAVDPPATTFVEQPAAHKTDSVARGAEVRSILYDNNGGRVSDDGRLVYAWDPRGLLVSATQKPVADGAVIRRVLYYYDGNHRMVGRRAEVAAAASAGGALDTLTWQLETRPDVLAADGLLPEVTLVWDPVSDNLVSVVQVGAAASDPNAGVLRQIIHGGLGYDDPIEVTAVTGTGTLTRSYPTYDEVGTGSLQAVMGASGQLVARNVPTDAYGNDRLELDGPAIDGITLEATGGGVDVTLHATEQLTESTVATGMRLAALDSNGAVVRTATATAALVAGDPYAARITLTSLEWNALTDPSATSTSGLAAQSLSVAATSTLRARGWNCWGSDLDSCVIYSELKLKNHFSEFFRGLLHLLGSFDHPADAGGADGEVRADVREHSQGFGSGEQREGQTGRFIAPGSTPNGRCKVALDLLANAVNLSRSYVLLQLEVLVLPLALDRQLPDTLHECLAAEIQAGTQLLPRRVAAADGGCDELAVERCSVCSIPLVKLVENTRGMEPWRRLLEAGGGAVTAPGPIGGSVDHPCPNRIQNDVAGDGEQVVLFLDELSIEPPLVEVSHALVPAIEVISVFAFELLHPSRESRLEGLIQEMKVIRHQAVLMQPPAVGTNDGRQEIEKDEAISIVEMDVTTLDTSIRDVPQSARMLETQRSSHRGEKKREGAGSARSVWGW
jgi:hypothetical protein